MPLNKETKLNQNAWKKRLEKLNIRRRLDSIQNHITVKESPGNFQTPALTQISGEKTTC